VRVRVRVYESERVRERRPQSRPTCLAESRSKNAKRERPTAETATQTTQEGGPEATPTHTVRHCIYAVSRVFTGDTRAPRATPPGGSGTQAPQRRNTPPKKTTRQQRRWCVCCRRRPAESAARLPRRRWRWRRRRRVLWQHRRTGRAAELQRRRFGRRRWRWCKRWCKRRRCVMGGGGAGGAGGGGNGRDGDEWRVGGGSWGSG